MHYWLPALLITAACDECGDAPDGEETSQAAEPGEPAQLDPVALFVSRTRSTGKRALFQIAPGDQRPRSVRLSDDVTVRDEKASATGRIVALLVSGEDGSAELWRLFVPATADGSVREERAPTDNWHEHLTAVSGDGSVIVTETKTGELVAHRFGDDGRPATAMIRNRGSQPTRFGVALSQDGSTLAFARWDPKCSGAPGCPIAIYGVRLDEGETDPKPIAPSARRGRYTDPTEARAYAPSFVDDSGEEMLYTWNAPHVDQVDDPPVGGPASGPAQEDVDRPWRARLGFKAAGMNVTRDEALTLARWLREAATGTRGS